MRTIGTFIMLLLLGGYFFTTSQTVITNDTPSHKVLQADEISSAE